MASKSARQAVRLSPRERQVLAFMAEHTLVVRRQVEMLTGGSAATTGHGLAGLLHRGYVRVENGIGEPCWLIRRAGLDAVASGLPVPKLKFGTYAHSVGLAWLWLAARAGAFGPVAEVIGERRMRSHDGGDISPQELYSVRLGGYAADGREHRHYPDVLLIDPHGRRLALELELSRKEVLARRRILGGYAADRRLDGVLYLVENTLEGGSIARGLRETATEMGLLDRVHIRRVNPILPDPAGGAAHGGREAGRATRRPPLRPGRCAAPAPARPPAEAGR